MKCYLCDRNTARVTVDTRWGTFTVCGVCDEVGEFCDLCERPMRSEEDKYHFEAGPWGGVPSAPYCFNCQDAMVDDYLENLYA